MFGGSILCAALLGSAHAQRGFGCEDCNVDLTAIEDFTSDYDIVLGSTSGPAAPITTSALPPMLPSDHGTIAVNARNLQLKVDNHLVFPENFRFPRPNPILNELIGHEIGEELHINGKGGQASYHLASPVLNACIQVDIPTPPIPHDLMEMQLQQAQQITTMLVQQRGAHVTVDGVQGVGLPAGPEGPVFIFTEDSHPDMVILRPIGPGEVVGLKFSNYNNDVGSAFSVRACEVETHSATQTMMVENPEVRDFFAQRIAEHQSRLQAVLEPSSLNTKFNFVPLEVAELMLAPAREGCTSDVLAETAPTAGSTFQTVVLGVCSFVMGVSATYGALRNKKAKPTDAYYQVSA